MNDSALSQLMGNYLFEDFSEVFGGVWEAIAAFAMDRPEAAAKLPAEISLVLEQYDERGLDEMLESLGSNVYMGDEPGGYRGWLSEISRRVQEKST